MGNSTRSGDLYNFLDTAGNGTGDINANGDYSTIGQNFLYTCPEGVQFVTIARAIIHYEDSGSFDADKYGNNITLTNGVEVRVEKRGETIDLTAGRPVQTNAHWGEMCFDTVTSTYGSGNNFLTVRWTFERSGKPIKLYPGESLIFYLSDDFSGLVEQYFKIQGQITW